MSEDFYPKVRWVIPQRVDSMSFVGRDVLVVAHDIYIVFMNLKTNTELVYVANSQKTGDGVDVVSGHKTQIFAFAEKIRSPRIFVMQYPSFSTIAELKDTEVNRYKGLCLMEGDLVAAFTGFPNYQVTVWSWRSCQRLICLPTNVVRRRQLYVPSRTHQLVCECWGEGLIVWEVAPSYRRTFMLKRVKEEVSGWEVSSPPLVSVCFTTDGGLYAVDPKANLYNLVSDGIGMVANQEWSMDIKGEGTPRICAFGNGILLYGPDRSIRWLKKGENKWNVVWTRTLSSAIMEVSRNEDETEKTETIGTQSEGETVGEEMTETVKEEEIPKEAEFPRVAEVTLDVAEQLASSAGGECAALWTQSGRLIKLVAPASADQNVPEVRLHAYKQRNIKKIEIIAPHFNHVATMNENGMLCIYEIISAKLVAVKNINGREVSFTASLVDPLLVVYGSARTGYNYGLRLLEWQDSKRDLKSGVSACLTHQSVSRVVISPTGRELLAACMSAGHMFIYKISKDYKLTLVRYMEVGRGLSDCFLMQVGESMRAFSIVLFSDKYNIGERVVCVNAETGKDNKVAGKMQGPYGKMLPLSVKDTILAIPHLTRQFHLLKLSGDQGVTLTVKMGPIVDSGHELKQFCGSRGFLSLLTYGADGHVILHRSDAPTLTEFKVTVSHRYEPGLKEAVANGDNSVVMHLGMNKTAALLYRNGLQDELCEDPRADPPNPSFFEPSLNTIIIIDPNEKNYLDLQEDKRVHEEALDYKKQRDEVVKLFGTLQTQLVSLLEENLREPPLHQLSLSEFNLHLEHKKERLKAAEKEREEIRLQAEARIRAQDKVTAWIKKTCWDTMLTPRIKIYAIFSHYHVENFPVLPTQRDSWPELEQTRELRMIEMMNDSDVFRPWEEVEVHEERTASVPAEVAMESQVSMESTGAGGGEIEEIAAGQPYALAGTNVHRYVPVPPFHIPQTLVYSFLQMNWMTHIAKLNVQNIRLWFNKQFDDLMATKRREVGLVEERNSRLRFIIEELNKLSDLRGSFHHLTIQIHDPQWRQEEQPEKLIKVEPEECTIPPYISPSQIVIVPPDPGPKDDFRERALNEMMDGVLEKLWHEEIKKPIPMPQCMLDKDPEHFTEEDLRFVFDYEAKVKFRNEERDKYRKMLHAEYAKLSQVLNEGVVKFNAKVKEMWLTRLRVDSVIGQETLNLMRLRRVNLDRVEQAEKTERIRHQLAQSEKEAEELQAELNVIAEQAVECQAAYDALASKDRYMDRTFKNNFADLSPIVVEQCYKYFKKRPKWHQRASMIPAVLYELAGAIATGVKPPLLHPDCLDYFKGVEQLDLISNMPAVMDEGLWASMCRLRRVKIDNEIRMRALALEMAYVESASSTWSKAVGARRSFLTNGQQRMMQLREDVIHAAMNRTIQVVLPAGQVEITTTGHFEDFEDAALILRSDVEAINNLILKVGDMKLRMMRRQIEFRKGILAKEWEHAQMKMKLRHMRQELRSYERLKIPKELQYYLKNKEKGYTEEMDYLRLEKEMAANKQFIDRVLQESAHRCEEIQVKISELEAASNKLEQFIISLHLKVSEKRINEDPLEPIRIRRIFKNRMEILVARSQLIREVQANHTTIVLLQTELELLRLKTYPTLASFQTFC